MAGAGVRLFTAGSQLLASQVNTYLMDQVVAYFADSAARDAAFGGAGEPTLSPGRVAYLFSDNKLYLYGNDNAWAEIGAQVEDGEITTAKLASSAVTAAKIASDAVTTAKILDSNVTTAKINDSAVTTAKIADSAITSAKIADDTIVNADISATAAIALSKLASGTAAQVVVHNGSGVPTATTVTGDVTFNSSGVTAISADSIVNADINSSAAIAYSKLNLATSITNSDIATNAAIALSKLASGTAAQVIINDSSGVPTATTVTGDVTISSSGVTAISSDTIVNADINASAAIAYSKLNLATSITNSDIATDAGIALTKVADVTISQKTTTPYVIALGDKNSLIEMNLAGANVVNVPTNASTAFPIGTVINIVQYGAGKTQVVASTPGTTSVRATPGNYLRDRYATAALIKRGTDEWYLIGDLSES
jgi:hypothetical protein